MDRKIAVLGDIRELGNMSEQLHRELSHSIDPTIIDKVYLFGSQMTYLYDELKGKFAAEDLVHIEADHAELIATLQADILATDVLLVKSSFGVDLLQVVTALTGQVTK